MKRWLLGVCALGLFAGGCRSVALGGKEQGMTVRTALEKQASAKRTGTRVPFDGDDARLTYEQQHQGPPAQNGNQGSSNILMVAPR